MTLASTFAPALGLSAQQQRIGFVIGIALVVLGGALWLRARPAPEAATQSVTAGRDAFVAGRDLSIGEPRAVRVRAVQGEIRRINARLDELERNRQEWQTILPHSHAPYGGLPSREWDRHGAAIGLPPDTAHAYDLASSFDAEMLRPWVTFGERPEPDLEALRAAFARATAELEGISGE